tara:strand:+ start:631 stop:1188 length:558 start_codon:yes stop_codon:yes gene_type:complete
MEREVSDRNILDKFCEDFCEIVENHCKYIIVSGFLVIASGRTRGTEDIDMIMEKISLEKFSLLFKELEKNDFICMQSSKPEEVYEYLIDNTSVRFTRKNSPLPEMEVKFVKDELDLFQLDQRVKFPLTGLEVWFSNVNINIAFKEEYLKSPKDLEDARHLRIVYEEIIDEKEIKRIKEMIKRLRL